MPALLLGLFKNNWVSIALGAALVLGFARYRMVIAERDYDKNKLQACAAQVTTAQQANAAMSASVERQNQTVNQLTAEAKSAQELYQARQRADQAKMAQDDKRFQKLVAANVPADCEGARKWALQEAPRQLSSW